jgi:hypothetical protein
MIFFRAQIQISWDILPDLPELDDITDNRHHYLTRSTNQVTLMLYS